MIKFLKLFQSFVHRILILASVVIVHGCGEVKVVQNPSSLTTIDPLTEIVSVDILDPKGQRLECIRIADDLRTGSQNLSPEDRDVFIKALTAHIAPLNYPVSATCENTIQIKVTEYNVNNLVFASRLVIGVQGEVRSDDGDVFWSARYRLSENAGSLPFDPISIGFGVASAAQNSSEDNRHNGAYLAVRRLLRGLPEHEGLPISNGIIKPRKASNPTDPLSEAMAFWQQDEFDRALAVMADHYTDRKATLGYHYGLMLEASGDEELASSVYSEAAIAQAKSGEPDTALKTLRRLQRLSEDSNGRHSEKFDHAVQTITLFLQN